MSTEKSQVSVTLYPQLSPPTFFSLRAHLQLIISTSLANHTVDHDSCGFSLQDTGGYIGFI